MKKIFTILLLVSGVAVAENLELELHLTSYHTDDDGYEEDNYGLGLAYYFKERWGVSGGGFNNSYDDTSLYLGLVYSYDLCASNEFDCTIGAIGGVVTGYEDHVSRASDVWPIVLPELKLGYKQYFMKSRFFPDLGSNASSALTFSLGREF